MVGIRFCFLSGFGLFSQCYLLRFREWSTWMFYRPFGDRIPSKITQHLGWVAIHPGRLTWNLKMMVWKMIFLFNWVIFRFHVAMILLAHFLLGFFNGFIAGNPKGWSQGLANFVEPHGLVNCSPKNHGSCEDNKSINKDAFFCTNRIFRISNIQCMLMILMI